MARKYRNYSRRRYQYRKPGRFKSRAQPFLRQLAAVLLAVALMFVAIGVGIVLNLPAWTRLPLMLAAALTGGAIVYQINWRQQVWRLKKRGWREPGLAMALGSVLLLTLAAVGTLYLYHRPAGKVPTLAGADIFRCNVVRVIDGDTFDCIQGQRVRLHAIAARERDGTCSPGHPCPSASAESAARKLRELVGWGALQCKPTGATYGRVAAICMNGQGVEINCAMANSGTALRWTRYEQLQPLCSGRFGATS